MGQRVSIMLAVAFTLIATTRSYADQITTPSGATIEILIDKPVGAGPFPVVVLAGGTNYPMREPLLAQTAQALVDQGVAVLRFDWSYYVHNAAPGKPSADRASEIEDMTTALTFARNQLWADKSRLGVAGKSLGSIIAWRVLRANADLRGALLLTPVCSPPGTQPANPQLNYPDIAVETRASVWILGARDPVCDTKVLYGFLATAGGPARVDVLGGNHIFESTLPENVSAPITTQRTIDLAARLASDFASTLLREAGQP